MIRIVEQEAGDSSLLNVQITRSHLPPPGIFLAPQVFPVWLPAGPTSAGHVLIQ